MTLWENLCRYTFTEMSCNICKTKLSITQIITSSDLMDICGTINLHEVSEIHRAALSKIENISVDQGSIIPKLESPIRMTLEVPPSADANSTAQPDAHTSKNTEDNDKVGHNASVTLHDATDNVNENVQRNNPVLTEPSLLCMRPVKRKISADHDCQEDQIALPPQKKPTVGEGVVFCDLCLSFYPSCETVQHINGRKHQSLHLRKTQARNGFESPQMGTWCEACSLWLTDPTYDTVSINIHNRGRKHQINLQQLSTSNTWCNICNETFPDGDLYHHIHDVNHKRLLLEIEPELINSFVIMEPGSSHVWCTLCSTFVSKIHKNEHHLEKLHNELENTCFTKKVHVFEYTPNNKDSFVCILCSALRGKTHIDECEVSNHCQKTVHISLVNARIKEQKKNRMNREVVESAITCPGWQCTVCWEIQPTSATISQHVQTLKHQTALMKQQRRATSSVAVEEPQHLVEATSKEKEFMTNVVQTLNQNENGGIGGLGESRFGAASLNNVLLSEDGRYCSICLIISSKKARSQFPPQCNHQQRLDSLRNYSLSDKKRFKLMHRLIREAEGIKRFVDLWPQLKVVDGNAVFCEVCTTTLANPYDGVVHVLQKSHQERINALRSKWLPCQNLLQISENSFRCELCDSFMDSLTDAFKHCKCDSHRKLIKLGKMSYSKAVTAVMQMMEISEGAKFHPDHLSNRGEGLYCNVCLDHLNSPLDAFKHVQMKSHLDFIRKVKVERL